MQQDLTKNWYQGCGKTVVGSEAEKKVHLKGMESKAIWVAQDKCDGEFAVVHGGKDLTVVNRKQNLIKGHGLHPFPEGTLIVGELAHGSQTSRKRKEELGHGVIDVFDILFFNHEWLGDLPATERRKRLEQWYRKLWKVAKPFYHLLPVWTDRFVERYNDAVEGLILKRMNGNDSKYVPGSKTVDWVKVKREIDVDMVIIDWEQSTASTKSSVPMCKNIIAGQYVNGVLTPLVRVGSMDHGVSRDVAENFQTLKIGLL